MGVSTFAHPCCQAFALPLYKDKQRSQPTPSSIINAYNSHTTWVYAIIHLRRRSVAITSCVQFLSCEVRQHRPITFVNAFSRPALQTAWWSHSSMLLTRRPSNGTGIVGDKITKKNLINNFFCKKIANVCARQVLYSRCSSHLVWRFSAIMLWLVDYFL